MRYARLLVLISLLAGTAAWAENPCPTEKLMAEAKARAAAEHKVLFVHFGASWCGWCGKLEKFMESPEIAPILDKHFVMVSLDVQEQDAKKKHLENEGGERLLNELGGEGKG